MPKLMLAGNLTFLIIKNYNYYIENEYILMSRNIRTVLQNS